MTPQSEQHWAERLATTVGQQVSRYRRELEPKLSAQELADRTAALGHEVGRSVIANLESGRRGTVTLADVLVLAAALGVPPAALAFPHDANEPLRLLPAHEVEPIVALEWFTGQRPLTYAPWAALKELAGAEIEHERRGQSVRDRLDIYRHHEQLLKLANTYALHVATYSRVAKSSSGKDHEASKGLEKMRAEQLRLVQLELDRLRLEMEDQGLYLPPLGRLNRWARGDVFDLPRQIERAEARLDRMRHPEDGPTPSTGAADA